MHYYHANDSQLALIGLHCHFLMNKCCQAFIMIQFVWPISSFSYSEDKLYSIFEKCEVWLKIIGIRLTEFWIRICFDTSWSERLKTQKNRVSYRFRMRARIAHLWLTLFCVIELKLKRQKIIYLLKLIGR